MEKSECIKILSYLNNCYNNRFKFPKANDKDGTATKLIVEAWYLALEAVHKHGYYNCKDCY